MRMSIASRRPRVVTALSVVVGLALVASPVAADEHVLEVECDADSFIDEDDDVVYFLVPGETLECTVRGLAAEDEASWGAFLYDQESDSDDPISEQGNPLEVVDGTASFSIEIPDEPPFIWMEALVTRGTDEEVLFYGTTEWYFEGTMTCTPDPVTEGETVECIAEDMAPDEEFWWWVVLFDDEDGYLELEGEGTADGDGILAFEFEVPAGEGYIGYEAEAEQELHFAWYEGEVEAAPTPPSPPTPPTPPRPAAPTVTPPTSQPAPQPVTVPQATRVDAGAGGTAPLSGPSVLLVGGLALAGLAVHRRLSTIR